MEYSVKQVEDTQKKLDELRPLTGDKLENVKDYYRIPFIYASNAIEGNTLNESETRAILEEGAIIGGHTFFEGYEVTGHAQAYDFMWELTKSNEINEDDIKKLNEIFYTQINESLAGEYRTEDVTISGSKYPIAPWRNIDDEMKAFFEWIEKERNQFHPIVFAAELYRRFVSISPFNDGNGITGRLLLNLALLQKGYEIIIISPESYSAYITAFEAGQEQPKVFHDFIIGCEVEAQKDVMRLFNISLND